MMNKDTWIATTLLVLFSLCSQHKMHNDITTVVPENAFLEHSTSENVAVAGSNVVCVFSTASVYFV